MIWHRDVCVELDVGAADALTFVGALVGDRLVGKAVGLVFVGAKLELEVGTLVGDRVVGKAVGLVLVGAKLELEVGALVDIFVGELVGVDEELLVGILEVDFIVGETVVEAVGV